MGNMTRARAQQICCQDTPYYHCISRGLRKAFLCGFDQTSLQDYERRRQPACGGLVAVYA